MTEMAPRVVPLAGLADMALPATAATLSALTMGGAQRAQSSTWMLGSVGVGGGPHRSQPSAVGLEALTKVASIVAQPKVLTVVSQWAGVMAIPISMPTH